MRERHPKKEVEDALSEAEAAGWRVEMTPKAHGWGKMLCPERSRNGCSKSIWSTPRSPGNLARDIRRELRNCSHTNAEE